MLCKCDCDVIPENGMTRGRFVEQVRDAVQYCDDEANNAFALISGLGGSDVDLIEGADIDALVDLFEGLSGTGEYVIWLSMALKYYKGETELHLMLNYNTQTGICQRKDIHTIFSFKDNTLWLMFNAYGK